jgi:hypothetical protein
VCEQPLDNGAPLPRDSLRVEVNVHPGLYDDRSHRGVEAFLRNASPRDGFSELGTRGIPSSNRRPLDVLKGSTLFATELVWHRAHPAYPHPMARVHPRSGRQLIERV